MKTLYQTCNQNTNLFFIRSFIATLSIVLLSESYAKASLIDEKTPSTYVLACNLSATVNVTQPSCGQTTGSISVTNPTGAANYRYKNGVSGIWQSGNSFSGLAPGNYNIYIQDASDISCEKLLGTYTVNTPPIAPTATITGSATLPCANTPVSRIASGGGTYLWSNGLGTSASVNISNAGTYTVTVSAANGCTATATTVVGTDVGVPSLKIVATADTLTCAKTQSVLTATPSIAGTYTYLWSNNTTFSNITVYDAGTYSVVATATNGCKASASIIIKEFNTVTAQVDVRPVLCKGGNSGTITIKGFDGISPYQFKLNNGSFQSANVFGNLVKGTYAVSIKDAGGCTASVNVVVNEPLNPLNFAVSPTNAKCFGSNSGKITATASGGTPAYQFAINDGLPQSSNIFNNLTAGTYTISVIDNGGCIITTTTTVTQATKIETIAAGSTIDCATPKGVVKATVTGGTPTYQFAIDGINFQPSGNFTNLNGGTYTITAKDANSCIGTATAAITVADTTKPIFNATATMVTCSAGTANNDGKLSISNIVNGVKYQYSLGGTFNAGSASPAVAMAIPTAGILTNGLSNPIGNSQTYTIRVYNNNDCYKDVTVELMKRVCACKGDICIPYKITKTKTR
ncbi:SprB repeat-containing protein [Emticicia sp. SJ17W-69]|uniref:SprB repeat-containing protein n=1 Tax=Emticicia sp. SJ17W-69 TaxID=3421657 RepID=UPI003EBF0AB5